MPKTGFILTAALLACASGQTAQADVVISTDSTSNMNCAGGVCTPTSSDAVLNVSDLENMLASSNVELAASSEPVDVDIDAALSWSGKHALTLDSYHSIRVNDPVTLANGGVSLVTNDGGSGGVFSFAPGASIGFSSLAGSLAINGASYTLVADIKTLAADIANAPGGSFALAGNYDASQDGVYSDAAVSTFFSGNFQGLGNIISNLAITSTDKNADVGLFAYAEPGSSISNLTMQDAAISSVPGVIGILAGENYGTVFGVHTGGEVSGGGDTSKIGGLVGFDAGSTLESSSSASVLGQNRDSVGGLLGYGYDDIVDSCFSTGHVTDKKNTLSGGLMGYAEGSTVSNSYATGLVKSGNYRFANVGGFLGALQGGAISDSYSTGEVVTGSAPFVGGFMGLYGGGTVANSDWDKTTSGQKNGVGNGPVSGITGLSSKKLKSKLPRGFDPSIWAEDEGVNHGFPYLIANPPPGNAHPAPATPHHER